jgi:protein tyrosine phosphatase (PTP) superfamily phosphohydrolase (DUF442 family)
MPEADLAAPPASPAASPPAPRGRWRWARRGAWAAAALGLLLVLAEAWRVLLGSNFHTVIPGRVYRCCQPTPQAVEEMFAAHGIRTVVNLRGCCNPFPWYLDEARATQRLDICQEDICLSAGRLPATTELRRLVEVLERSEPPLVLHCRRGADRTGLAAAVALLLLTDTPPAAAARQLGVRYGHVPLGRPACLDTFLDLYEGWLSARGLTHARAAFRHWALEEYTPGGCSAALELLSARPLRVRRGEPAALRVRARNTGLAPWHFRPTANAGVHVGFHVWDERDCQVAMGKCGLYDAEVAPGQSIDVTLPLPALGRAGRYRLMIDLSDERRCWFFQVGSEPLEEELEVCD